MVDRKIVSSRSRAQALIMAGKVLADEFRVEKAGQRVPVDAAIRIKEADHPYVSRGGVKLQHALRSFDLDPAGLRCLDLGASTGGFTDCLLSRGAKEVISVDVGYGQLHPRLRSDRRVKVLERTNARYLTLEDIGGEPVDFVVVDCSFISIELLIPAISSCILPGGRTVALVKPQFEVGRGEVGKGGVVRDSKSRRAAVDKVSSAFTRRGFSVLAVVESPIRGPAGNVEYLMHAVRSRLD